MVLIHPVYFYMFLYHSSLYCLTQKFAVVRDFFSSVIVLFSLIVLCFSSSCNFCLVVTVLVIAGKVNTAPSLLILKLSLIYT